MRDLHRRKLKVRTGCITCKIRKVKCDEIKPACKRCTDTGRTCDGYPNLNALNSDRGQRSLVPVRPEAQHNLVTSLLHADTVLLPCVNSGEDRKWLHYFASHSETMFSGLADRIFWSSLLPQLSFSEPAVRHALLAIGAMHAALEHESSASPVTTNVGFRYSMKHYNDAIKVLRPNLSPTLTNLEVPLICCLLFICLECLYGDQALMLDHLRSGLGILTSPSFQRSENHFVMSIKPSLQQVFRRLDAQTALFERPSSSLFGSPLVQGISMLSTSFADVSQAQTSLDILVSLALNFIRTNHDEILAGHVHMPSTFTARKRLKAQFDAWKDGMDRLVAACPSEDNLDMSLMLRLRIQYYAIIIYLGNCLEEEESSYDAFEDDFTCLVHFARTLLEPGSPPGRARQMTLSALTSGSAIFSLDAMLIPSLYLTGLKCRNPVIRRDAILLLDKAPIREWMWDVKLHGRVARRVVEIEESGMLISQGATTASMEPEPSLKMQACGMLLTERPAERFRVHNADIHREINSVTRSVRIIFTTAPKGLTEERTTWQEVFHFPHATFTPNEY